MRQSSSDILTIEKRLKSRIFGQDHIIKHVIDMLCSGSEYSIK